MTLEFVAYFALILWSGFWGCYWLALMRAAKRDLRPGPKDGLFEIARAWLIVGSVVSLATLIQWGWLPAAVALAYWLAS